MCKIIEECSNCGTEDVPGVEITDGMPNEQETAELCEFCMHSSGVNRIRFYPKIVSNNDYLEAQMTATLARVHWQEVERRKDKKGVERKSKDTGVR